MSLLAQCGFLPAATTPDEPVEQIPDVGSQAPVRVQVERKGHFPVQYMAKSVGHNFLSVDDTHTSILVRFARRMTLAVTLE